MQYFLGNNADTLEGYICEEVRLKSHSVPGYLDPVFREILGLSLLTHLQLFNLYQDVLMMDMEDKVGESTAKHAITAEEARERLGWMISRPYIVDHEHFGISELDKGHKRLGIVWFSVRGMNV